MPAFCMPEKFFKVFLRKRQNIHSPKAKEWRGKTIPTLREEEKP